jgi:hypothetical protein
MSESTGGKAKPRAKTKEPKARSGPPPLRGWDASADGAQLTRTLSCGTAEEAGAVARKALVSFHKAAKPIELRVDGASVTLRIAAAGGQVDEQTRLLAQRMAPKDPAKAAARAAARAGKAAAGGEA